MFKVIVLACAVSSPDVCYEYHSRDVYDTYEKCTERALEMRGDIIMINRGSLMPKAYRCIPLKGTRL